MPMQGLPVREVRAHREARMSWSKIPPAEPGQYKIRRTYWGGRTRTDAVLVYEDDGELWVVEYSNSLAPDINQPMDEWLKEQPPVRWRAPIASQCGKREETAHA